MLDFSAMKKINNFSFGILFRPNLYVALNENLNSQLKYPWFGSVSMQINVGSGYKISTNVITDFDIHCTIFHGYEILIGTNLSPTFSKYAIKTNLVISLHLGLEYKTLPLGKYLFIRSGYYYQPALFENINSKNHLTVSFSWKLIKLPQILVLKTLSIGASSDIAENYNVQTLTLDFEL
ncbi:MAG: hypothetical protein SNJ64_01040 [Endomicrobiia bacterium]